MRKRQKDKERKKNNKQAPSSSNDYWMQPEEMRGGLISHYPSFAIKAVEHCYLLAWYHQAPYKSMSLDPAVNNGNVQKCADEHVYS